MTTSNCSIECDKNPLEDCPYRKLPVLTKVSILKALCEWQLDYCEQIQQHIAELKPSKIDGYLRREPIGKDSQGYYYWRLDTNDKTARLYREKPSTSYDKSGRLLPEKWETVSSNLKELKEFAESLKGTTDSDEKELLQIIENEMLPPLLEKERLKEQAAKRLAKQEVHGLSLRNIITGTARTRRARKDINYAYMDEENFEDFLSYR